MNVSFPSLAAWWQRSIRRMQEARRLRAAMRELAHMSSQELRDIGFTHPAMATAAAANAAARC